MKHEKIFSLLSEIITGICSHKQALKIFTESHSPTAHKLTVMPHMADYRKLVGKGGRTIKAFQSIVKSIGNAQGMSLNLDLQESFTGTPELHEQIRFNDEFDQVALKRLVSETAAWLFAVPIEVEVVEGTQCLEVFMSAPVTIEAQNLVSALNAVFYPYARANGRVVEVKQKQK